VNKLGYSERIYNAYNINFGNICYPYYLYGNRSERFLENLLSLEDVDSFIVISDRNVANLYGNMIVDQLNHKYSCHLIEFECTENNKNLQVLGSLIEKVLSLKATRRTCIIGLGGGICGNMAGMVASLLFRGIKFVHIPTSLMAISDSVLSLKQAINSSYGKNLIGLFYTPTMVIANIDFLETSPKYEIVSGLCEIIKNALTILPDSIEQVYQKLDSKCNYTPEDYRDFIDLAIKAKTMVMKDDPFEKMDALILEYGHTIGHAIELAEPGVISHGEAVGLGMLCAANISHSLGYLCEEEVALHKNLLMKVGASTKIPPIIHPDNILSFMKFDNKRGYVEGTTGSFHMILLEKIGKPLRHNDKMLVEVPEELVKQTIVNMYD